MVNFVRWVTVVCVARSTTGVRVTDEALSLVEGLAEDKNSAEWTAEGEANNLYPYELQKSSDAEDIWWDPALRHAPIGMALLNYSNEVNLASFEVTTTELRWKNRVFFSPSTHQTHLAHDEIKAWKVQTRGQVGYRRLVIYTASPFKKAIETRIVRDRSEDILRLNRFLAHLVVDIDTDLGDTPESTLAHETKGFSADALPNSHKSDNVLTRVLQRDYYEGDATVFRQSLQDTLYMLGNSEVVEKAYNRGQDVLVFTNKRIILGEVAGPLLKRSLDVTTIPWSAVKAYSVQPANGHYDTDVELWIWTDIPGLTSIRRDLNRGKADTELNVNNLLSYLNSKVLPGQVARSDCPKGVNNLKKLSAWSGSRHYLEDSQTLTTKIKEDIPCLLEDAEAVRVSFRRGRDVVMLTNLRVLWIDTRRTWFYQKTQMTSIPGHALASYNIQSKGFREVHQDEEGNTRSSLDRDHHFTVTTRIFPYGDSVKWSSLTWDIDAFTIGMQTLSNIQRELDTLIGGLDDFAAVRVTENENPREMSVFERLFAVFTSSGYEQGNEEVTTLFRDSGWIGMEEHVLHAYVMGRDHALYTDRRLLIVDYNETVGRWDLTTFPWTSVDGYEVTEAGGILDRTDHAAFYLTTPSTPYFRHNLARNFVNVFQLQRTLTQLFSGKAEVLNASQPMESWDTWANRKENVRVLRDTDWVTLATSKCAALANSSELAARLVRSGSAQWEVRSYCDAVRDYVARYSVTDLAYQVEENTSATDHLRRFTWHPTPWRLAADMLGNTSAEAGETIVRSFRNRHDEVLVFTDRRIILSSLPLFGSALTYRVVPYTSIVGMSLGTPGILDTRSMLQVWTRTSSLSDRLMFRFALPGADIRDLNLFVEAMRRYHATVVGR